MAQNALDKYSRDERAGIVNNSIINAYNRSSAAATNGQITPVRTVSGGYTSQGGSSGYGGGSQQSYGATFTMPKRQNSTSSTLSRIAKMARTDPTRATEAMNMFRQLQNDPTSKYYNPYSRPTNRAVDYLTDLGWDMSGGVDDRWFAGTEWLKQYNVYTANTNSLSSTMTNRRSTPEQKSAYYRNQLWLAEEDTKKAESEWNDVLKAIDYWTNVRSDLNLSDEDIIQRINIAGNSKYKTLAKMDETKLSGTPMELNRAIAYDGEDSLYAAIWAARNGGSTGDIYQDMINSYDGVGNVWKRDDALAAKLDYNNKDTFDPYSVGMVGMDDVGAYFGVGSFDWDWANRNQALAYSDNEDDQRNYQKVIASLENRDKAQGELDELNKSLERKLRSATDPEKVLSSIDWTDYPTLLAINKYMGTGYSIEAPNGKAVSTSGALNYRYNDIVKRVNDACEVNRSKKDGDGVIDSFAPPKITGVEGWTNSTGLSGKDDEKYIEQLSINPTEVRGGIAGTTGAANTNFAPGVGGTAGVNVGGGQNVAIPGTNTTMPVGKAAAQTGEFSIFRDGFGRGNIDLNARKVLQNDDGSFSTEESFTVGFDGKSVLLPSIINGVRVSDEEAIQNYLRTGENLGIFDTAAEADAYADLLHRRQEIYYGQDAADGATGPKAGTKVGGTGAAPREKTGTQKTEEALNGRVQDALMAMEGSLTPGEIAFFNSNPGVEYTRIRDEMLQGPLNPATWTDEAFKEFNFRRVEADANANYNRTALGSLAMRHQYEKLQDTEAQLRTAIDGAWEQYGDRIYAAEELPDRYVTITLSNGNTVGVMEDGTTISGEDLSELLFRSGYDTPAQNAEEMEKVSEKLRVYREYADQVRAAKEKYGDLSGDESVPRLADIEAMEDRLNGISGQVEAGRSAYDEALAEIEKANTLRTVTGGMLLRNGYDIDNPQDVDDVLNVIGGYLDWEAPAVETESLVHQLMREAKITASDYKSGENGREMNRKGANTAIAEIDEAIADAKYLLSYFDDVPEEIAGKLNEYIDYMTSQRQQYQYFKLTQEEKYGEYVSKGRTEAEKYRRENLDNPPSATQFFREQMTDDERDLYYGIYGRYGKDAADKYYADIEQNLIAQTQGTIQANAEELSQSGAGGRVANLAFGVAMAPLEALASAINIGVTAMRGEGSDVLGLPSYMSKAAIGSIQEEVGRVYKDKPLVKDLVSGVYEILYNRGRSATSGVVFGGLFPEGASEIVKAFPIALTAADDTLQKYLEAGVEPWKAATLSAITFLSESVTEGIELKKIQDAFGVGKDISRNALATFFREYIPKALPEVVGESLNDIAEKVADYWIAGDKGDIQGQIRAMMEEDPTLSEQDAYDAVMRTQIADVMHTAMISFFSGVADLGAVAAGSLQSYAYYADQARRATNLTGQKVTARELRTQDRQRILAERGEGDAPAREPGAFNLARPGELATGAAVPDITSRGFTEDARQANTDQYDIEFNVLASLQGANPTATTATLAAVLRTEGGDINRAGAAAVKLQEIMGRDTVGVMEELMAGGVTVDININILKSGIQMAAMADGSCRSIMTSDSFRRADPETKARWIAEAVAEDARNQTVQNQVAGAVHDFRVSEEMKRLQGDGAAKPAMEAQRKARDAKKATDTARDLLTQKTDDVNAKQEATKVAGEAAINEPTADNMNAAEKATNELRKAAEVEQEYQQHLENIEAKEKETVVEAQRVTEETTAEIRRQAEATVAQQEQVEAEAAAEAQRAAEEQEAQRIEQARIQEEAANAMVADVDSFIDSYYPNASDEDKTLIRNLAKSINDQRNGVDVDELLNRKKITENVSKKYNVGIRVVDTTNGGTVARQNGYYDRRTNTIVLDSQSSMSDMMYFVMGHELTHVAEQSGTYTDLANSLLRMRYGKDADYASIIQEARSGQQTSQMAVDVAVRKALYDERLAMMHEQDSSIDATPLTEEEALQEIVADEMGKLLNGDQELVNRLAAEEPSTLRRIIESIKSFIRKATGMQGEWLTDAQRTVDMLETALKDVQTRNGQSEQAGQSKRYSMETTAQPVVTNDQGEGIVDELPGGTIVRDESYSLATWTEEEQNRVREALLKAKNANGTKRFTTAQVDKYLKDTNSIAKEIADNKGRLDFEANPDQKFLKSNNDYYFTLDASTLCAKRLLYQGTFNYVQHALPDEVFTPTDLIDLVNIMSEDGYETPCGICYVESRRRWLDTYANEFIQKIEENPDAYVEKLFEKASDDYKAEMRERFAGELPSIDDLTTTDGLENLRKNDPLMHKAFVTAMNAKGSANPKVVQPRAAYDGDIRKLTDKDIQKVKDIGGLRIQSFSDFETPHLLDMMQAVMDMSARGLTSQAYTKVPNFAWVFGDTGIKINLSLIGKGTGLDDNGNLVFDNKEGMNFDEAMRLRDRYSQNVGTIIVGINDDHIVAAMGDPRIDFIIPFHKSGWSDLERKGIKSLQYYEDYTDTQNERKLYKDENGKVVRNKDGSYKTIPAKESKIVNFEPVGAHAYWNFNKNGEWNARKYLRMCAKDGRIPKFSQFLVDNGNGSFSLPEGDDKRSKAIREGYWKTLIDFKMYDNDGKGAKQKAVTAKINMSQAYRVLNEYTLERPSGNPETKMVHMKSNNDVPVATTSAEKFIELIKERRRGNTPPTNPNDNLEATPEIDVTKLGRNQFAGEPLANLMNGTAAMASGAEAELGNTPSEYQEAPAQNQQMMAVDAETGETVRRKYSLPKGDPEAERLLNQYRTAQQTEIDLRDRKKQIDNSDEMKSWESRMMDALGGDLEAVLAEYKQWETETGYADISKAYEEAKKATKDASKAYDTYVEQRNVRDEQEKIAASGLSEPDWRRKEAIKEFGYTTNVNEAGYMLPNGKMLNFTGEKGKHYGYRGQDHRAIGTIYASQEKQFTAAMNAFMNDGNIRLMPESPGIDISNAAEPTPEQYSGIRSMIRSLADKEYFSVDFSDQNGRNIGSLEYEGRVRPDRVVNDIKAFFQTGEVPQQNGLDRFRYSLPVDAPYMAAVERGEMDRAQEMVDERAEEAGYTDKVYHGTPAFGFTQFDMDASQGEIFVAYDDVLAATYTRTNAKVRNLSDAGKSISDMSDEDLWLYADENLKTITDENGDKWKVKVFPDSDGTFTLRMKGIAFGSEDLIDRTITRKELEQYLQGRYERTSKEGVYQLYAKPVNQLVVDAEDNAWNDIPFNGGIATTREIAEWARDNGYDSVRINNVFDNGGRSSRRFDGMDGYGDIGIMFNPDAVKSADTVVYDDQGNVIPLSERFQTKNPDIRYSLPSEDLLRQQYQNYIGRNRSAVQTNNDAEAETARYNAGITDRLEGMHPEMSTGQGPAIRKFASESGMLKSNQEISDFAKAATMALNTYYPDTNADQIQRAIQWIGSLKQTPNSDGYAEAMQAVTSKNFDYRSADGQARMVAVTAMANAKNDVMAQVAMADSFMRQGSDLGRALQARKLFMMMTPEGRIASIQKMIDNANDEIMARTGRDPKLRFSDWITLAAANAQNESDMQKVREAAEAEIKEQIPANWRDRLTAWRMTAMLMNPKTHIRNIVGNALFAPAVSLKNKMGAVIELGMEKGNRTKTLTVVLPKEIREFASQDAIAMKDVLTGEAKYKERNEVRADPFKGVMKAISDFNSNMLEGEDWFFLKGHYRRALGGWMQANGYTAEQMRSNPALLEQGREYAISEAKKATYRDFSATAKWLNNPIVAGKEIKPLKFFIEAALPFKKTPINILKRGVEYSPVVIARSLTTDLYHLKQYQDYQQGKLDALPEKAISPNQFIDRLCSGLTGTGIMAMGAILANMGIVTCGLDDDDDEFEKERGGQAYAIDLGFMGIDGTYTIDWAAPMSMPFFVGAAIQGLSKNEAGFDIDALVNGFGNIAEPVFNLSMLDGVNSLLSVSQSDSATITQIFAKVGTNYATSMLPSVIGAITRTFFDDTSRKAYVESGKKTGPAGTARYAIEQAENKIPGLSKTNIPIRDVWGNAKTSGFVERLLENFVSPGYYESRKDDPVTREMAALYEQTGATSVIPKEPAQTFSAGGQKYVLSAEQWDKYKTVRGQTAHEGLDALIKTDEYKNGTADAKIKMVEAVWDYANERGKLAVDPGNQTQRITVNKKELDKAMDAGDWEAYEAVKEALLEDGVTDDKIKTQIGNRYRDQYKDAYMAETVEGDERMNEIADILENTGYDFKLEDWEKAARKKAEEDEESDNTR